MARSPRTVFLFKNLSRGLLWLAILVAGFIVFNHSVDIKSSEFLMAIGDNAKAVYLVYFLSEIFVGIIPPEVFMMWSIKLAEGRNYILDVSLLALISYIAGSIAFLFGRYFHQTVIYRYLRRRYLGKFEIRFQQFGGFLLFVAALTPIPYSGICMLSGAAHYSKSKFYLITLFRFIRYAIYGYFIWRASLV
ncbi:MAG: VTT domain-containing protein [Bacteroidota bacterium]